MDIGEYIGINYNRDYKTNELNNILSKFSNLDMKNYYMQAKFIRLLRNQHVSTITKFIDMFKDVNEFEAMCGALYEHSLAGKIIYIIMRMHKSNEICVYKILDHLFKSNMNTKVLARGRNGGITYGVDFLQDNDQCANYENYITLKYVFNNYNIIQNIRKIINNYDMILFDIVNDLQFIKSLLLVTKHKNKIVPKFIIIHKILYYYLLDKNIMYNQVEVQ